mgnify:CR=1 FL=1
MRYKNAELFPMIENFINQYREKYDTSPSVQEIADHIEVSKATASRYLSYMRGWTMMVIEVSLRKKRSAPNQKR